MNGILILLLLTVTAALPLIIVFFRIKAHRPQITPAWFLAAVTAGILALLAAALIQSFFPHPVEDELAELLFGVFIRVAAVEEASRLLILIPLIKAAGRFNGGCTPFGAAIGLIAGLSFAAVENAYYGMADINIAMLRAFTAAPLHGACGIRAGAAVSLMSRRPAQSLFLLISAIIFHSAYNLIIVSPAIPSLLAVAVAVTAFLASLHLLNIDL